MQTSKNNFNNVLALFILWVQCWVICWFVATPPTLTSALKQQVPSLSIVITDW